MDESFQPHLRKRRSRRNPCSITKRKREVLYYCFLGKTNAEIGAILGISALTVKNHILNSSLVLNAHNRANAVYNAIQKGILDIPGYVYVGTPKEAKVAVEPCIRWIQCGRLEVSPDACEARVGPRYLKLGVLEMKLLLFLVQNPGAVHSRQKLLDKVWGADTMFHDRVVDVHILRLRRALEAHRVRVIETVPGFGYRLKA